MGAEILDVFFISTNSAISHRIVNKLSTFILNQLILVQSMLNGKYLNGNPFLTIVINKYFQLISTFHRSSILFQLQLRLAFISGVVIQGVKFHLTHFQNHNTFGCPFLLYYLCLILLMSIGSIINGKFKVCIQSSVYTYNIILSTSNFFFQYLSLIFSYLLFYSLYLFSLFQQSFQFIKHPMHNNQHNILTPTTKQYATNQQPNAVVEDHDYLAYLMQALACIIWTCSYVYTNQHKFDVFEVNMAKGIVGTFLNYIILHYRGFSINFQSPKYFKWLLILNFFILLYFYALPFSQLYLPLPIVHTIGCSSIAVIYVIDYVINGTKITRTGLVGIVFAFFGVVLMANNRLIMSLLQKDQFHNDNGNYLPSSVLLSSFIALILFISRLLNCYGLVKLKHFPEISIFQLNYHNNIFGLFTAAIGYMFVSKHVSLQIFWPSLITIGIGQFICMTCFFYSLKLTKKTGNVMVINALNIIVAFVLSYFRYDQKFNLILILGSSSIFVGMLVIIIETMKLKRKATNKIKENEIK